MQDAPEGSRRSCDCEGRRACDEACCGYSEEDWPSPAGATAQRRLAIVDAGQAGPRQGSVTAVHHHALALCGSYEAVDTTGNIVGRARAPA